jgi:hypothetical protein
LPHFMRFLGLQLTLTTAVAERIGRGPKTRPGPGATVAITQEYDE